MGRSSAIQLAPVPGEGVSKRRGRPRLAKTQPRDLDRPASDFILEPLDSRAADRLFTMPEAAEYLRYTGDSAADSAYSWLRRHGLLKRRGNLCLARRSDIDRVLDGGDSGLVARALAHRGGR